MPDWKHGTFRHEDYLVDRTARSILAPLVAASARSTVKALIRILAAAQRGLATADSTRWRDDVEHTRSPYGDDPRHLVLELLRDAIEALAERESAERGWAFEQLEAQESEIFERLRLHLLAVLPDEAARREAALADADILFGRAQLGEVYRLLPVHYAECSDDEKHLLLGRIEQGPAPSRYGLPPAELEQLGDEIERWQDEWRQRLLSALESQLDENARQRLEALRDRRGSLPNPGFGGIQSTSWIGPTSPKSALQLATMEHDEFVALLRDFRAEHHVAVPTPEGLDRELAHAVESDPQRWSWLAMRLSEIPPLYVRSWLTGLNAVLRGGALLPDLGILNALTWVLEQPADAGAGANPLDVDIDFYSAQLAAADVLVGLLSSASLTISDRDRAWRLINRLAADADPTPEREASTEAEPLQLGLVALRSRGAVGLLRYVQWLDGRLPDGARPSQRGFAAVPETQGQLERFIDEDPSHAVRAVLAAELPVLAALDNDWLAARITAVADPHGSTLAQVGWTTYVRYGALYGNVTTLLADSYLRAVAAITDMSHDDDRRQLTQHVAVIWRDLPDTVPRLLEGLLRAGSDDDRARAMGTLGRALHKRGPGDYEPTAADLERHRQLWDSRLKANPGPLELREFGWWWSSSRFRREEDIQRFTATLAAAHGRIGDIRDAVTLVWSYYVRIRPWSQRS